MSKEWLGLAWYERICLALGGLGSFVVACIGLIMVMYVISSFMDLRTDDHIRAERCLKQATNGLEIERCKR